MYSFSVVYSPDEPSVPQSTPHPPCQYYTSSSAHCSVITHVRSVRLRASISLTVTVTVVTYTVYVVFLYHHTIMTCFSKICACVICDCIYCDIYMHSDIYNQQMAGCTVKPPLIWAAWGRAVAVTWKCL